MSILKIAIQKQGRLSEKSLKLLQNSGIKVSNGNRKLKTTASNFPIEVLYLRDDDIPQYVEQGVADVGILGQNVILEQNREVDILLPLGFAQCRMCLALPKDIAYSGIQYFQNKRIATSYSRILQAYFKQEGIQAEVENISGSVEIAPSIGLADGIFDIVSTGSTLIMNGLVEVQTVMNCEAMLISNPSLEIGKREILNKLLFRFKAVQASSANKYILLNAPTDAVKAISEILPGMKSPSVLPLAEIGWSSIHSVIPEDAFWEITDQLKDLGAEGILVLPIEKMIL